MTKKITKPENVREVVQEEQVREFIDWYIRDLSRPRSKDETIPFYIELSMSNPNDQVLIFGEENIASYLKEKKASCEQQLKSVDDTLMSYTKE